MKLAIVLLACFSAPCVALPSMAQDATTVRPSASPTRDSTGSQTPQDSVDWPQVGMGFSTAVGNLFYIPAKIAYGTLGGLAGGAAYVFTRGDHQVAHKIWRTSLGGDYLLTPPMLRGQEPIHFVGSDQDSAQVGDTFRPDAALVQTPPLASERSVNGGAIGKKSDPTGIIAEHRNLASLEIPRADQTTAPAGLSPKVNRPTISNQESVPKFSIVPQ